MDKAHRNDITDFLIKILEKSDLISYTLVDFEDDDINFIISPKLTSLKVKDKDKLRFILYCSDVNVITIYCPTLYKLTDKDSVMYALDVINNVNAKIAIGKIYLNKNNGSVITYINRILFNDIFKELSIDLLESYIQSYLWTAVEFYKQMKEGNFVR